MENEVLHLTVYGNPYIKKNSQRTIWHKYLKRTIVVYSANYTTWKRDALKQLGLCQNGYLQKVLKEPIDYPVIFKAHFYRKTRHITDLSANYEGIQDVLVEAKVLKDDNSNIIKGHDGSRIFYDKENPRVEFWITKATEEGSYQK